MVNKKVKRIFLAAIFFHALLLGSLAYSLEPSWEELHQKAENFRAEKKYAQSLKTYEKLLKLTQDKYGEKNVKAAEVLLEMALLNRYDLGNEKKYAELQEKAQKIQLTLNGKINCRVPEKWTYAQCRERWLGNDPCFMFRNVNDYIKVTYYGLEGSEFKKPEDFIKNLKGLFGQFETSERVKLDGRKTILIKLRYEQGKHYDHHGGYRLPEFLYEEFLILSLKEGFFVFNFKLNHLMPIPFDFTKENESKKLYGDAYDEYQTWMSFIDSCQINQ